jgi:phosphoketolase
MTEPEPPSRWSDFLSDAASGGLPVDPNALVQYVLRESYLQTTEDLRSYAEKVNYYNQVKKHVRAYLGSLRDFQVAVCRSARDRGIDIRRADENDSSKLAEIFKEQTRPYDARHVACELSIPDRVPAESVSDFEQLEAEIKSWEEELNSIGDDAQLANVDLQNMLQRQQQTLQMMSNISKMLHDTSMSVIRKLGG